MDKERAISFWLKSLVKSKETTIETGQSSTVITLKRYENALCLVCGSSTFFGGKVSDTEPINIANQITWAYMQCL